MHQQLICYLLIIDLIGLIGHRRLLWRVQDWRRYDRRGAPQVHDGRKEGRIDPTIHPTNRLTNHPSNQPTNQPSGPIEAYQLMQATVVMKMNSFYYQQGVLLIQYFPSSLQGRGTFVPPISVPSSSAQVALWICRFYQEKGQFCPCVIDNKFLQ